MVDFASDKTHVKQNVRGAENGKIKEIIRSYFY